MAFTNMVEINPEKLKVEFIKRGVDHREAAREVGHNSNYFTDAFRRKRISASAARMLKYLYNIIPDDYVVNKNADTSKTETTTQKQEEILIEPVRESVPMIDYEKIEKIIKRNTLTERELYKVIYQAVFRAVDKAWKQ